MSFLRARRQHWYRGLVGVDDAVRQHGFAHRIDWAVRRTRAPPPRSRYSRHKQLGVRLGHYQ
jgi:hypothetical protein